MIAKNDRKSMKMFRRPKEKKKERKQKKLSEKKGYKINHILPISSITAERKERLRSRERERERESDQVHDREMMVRMLASYSLSFATAITSPISRLDFSNTTSSSVSVSPSEREREIEKVRERDKDKVSES